MLEIANPRNVSARLDEDEKGVHQADTPGGKQDMTIVNEPGLYNVILRSDKPEAKGNNAYLSTTQRRDCMNELIKINYDNDTPTVSARELHEFLEVGTAFKDWFPRMCEYGFTKDVDFNPLKIERVQNEGDRLVNRMVDDAAITVEMAKELCMIQRNERGKQARQYFIQLEPQERTNETGSVVPDETIATELSQRARIPLRPKNFRLHGQATSGRLSSM